jgi:SAM-dependent methyltransferase
MADDNEQAADRWRALVLGRLAEVARLAPDRAPVGPSFWDSRARRFAARLTVEAAAQDPFLRRIKKAGGRQGSFLDVGAGTGRFTLNLAGPGRLVTAVDPSPGMLKVLRRQASERALSGHITTVLGRWEDVEVEPANVAFSSYVVSIVEDAPRFLTKLTRAARRQVYLYLGAYSMDAVMDPLWRYFHGTSRSPGPSYLDAIAVLRQMGVAPDVEVVELPNRTRFDTVAEAAKEYADYLLLPPGRPTRRQLEGLLTHWLVSRDGRLAPPLRFVPAAIVSWPGTANDQGPAGRPDH